MNYFDSSIPLITFTKEGKPTYVNEGFKTSFGYKNIEKIPFLEKFLVLVNSSSQTTSLKDIFEHSLSGEAGIFCNATISHFYHHLILCRLNIAPSSVHKDCFDVRFFEIDDKGKDLVTGLPNGWAITSQYSYFLDTLGMENLNIGYFIVSVDNFSSINFRYGYKVGDEYLIVLANAFQKVIGENALVVRFHNARFGILVNDDNKQSKADFEEHLKSILDRINCLFSKPITVETDDDGLIEVSKTFSLGAVLDWRDYNSFFEMESAADRALLMSEARGGSVISFACVEYAKERILQRKIVDLLPSAIENLDIDIHFQPQLCLAKEQLIGFEALARWEIAETGFIPPLDFVATAEKLGLNIELDMCILTKVCLQIVAWKSSGYVVPRIAVNMSAKTLEFNGLVPNIVNILNKTECPASNIEIEITETDKVTDSLAIVSNLTQLLEHGIIFAMDDFGTGYSSLSLLRTFDFALDKLKLDIELTEKVCKETKDINFIQQIIDLGKNLDIKVLAEGVEESQQRDALLAMNCDYAQGYYFNKPLIPSLAENLLSLK